MKVWLLCLLGLALFIAAGIWVQYSIKSESERFGADLKNVQRNLDSRRWEAAGGSLEQLEKKWTKTRSFWALILHHREIDNIEQALERSKKAIATQSESDAEVEVGTLRFFLEHVYEREKLSWVSIF